MKIAVLTFSRALNYGAALQLTALCHVLKEMKHDVTIIDYITDPKKNYYRLIHTESLKALLLSVYKFPNEFSRFRSFKKFVRQNKLTEPYQRTTISQLPDEFDMYITGSDQVWGNHIHGFDKSYYLDFVKDSSKKASYAASIGTSYIKDEDKAEVKALIEQYGYISVREKGAKELLKELLPDKDIYVSLDPTLLLGKEQWKKYCADIPRHKEKYILIYHVAKPLELINYAQELAKRTGFKIYYVNRPVRSRVGKAINNASPEKFLALFRDAQYVLTNSFHGTVFSVVFQRQFFVEGKHQGFSGYNYNHRAKDLLESIGLENRIFDKENPVELIDNPIAWKETDELMHELRRKSLSYLNRIRES